MSKCSVVGCKSEHNPFNPAVSFHRITRNKKYLPLWEKIVKLKTKSVQAKICSLHFKDKDFDEGKGRRVLKSHAVPSFNVIDGDNSTDDDDDDNEKLSMLKRALRTSKGASIATAGVDKTSEDSDYDVNDPTLPQNFQMASCCDPARTNKQTSNMGIQTKIKTDREISLQAKVKLLELRLRRRDAKISYMKTVLGMIKKHTKGTDMEYKLCCELQNIGTESIDGNVEDKIKSINRNEMTWKDERSSGEEDNCTFVEVVHSPNLKGRNGI